IRQRRYAGTEGRTIRPACADCYAVSLVILMSNVVVCLFSGNGFDRAAQGAVGAGRRLADQLGGKLHAIVLGELDDATKAGLSALVETISVADQNEYQPEPCLNALTQLCRDLAPHTVLFGNDTYSQELAPRLAYRLGGSAVADGVKLLLHDGK